MELIIKVSTYEQCNSFIQGNARFHPAECGKASGLVFCHRGQNRRAAERAWPIPKRFRLDGGQDTGRGVTVAEWDTQLHHPDACQDFDCARTGFYSRLKPGKISRIERGLIVPAVATLYKIAAAMGMCARMAEAARRPTCARSPWTRWWTGICGFISGFVGSSGEDKFGGYRQNGEKNLVDIDKTAKKIWWSRL